MNIISNIPDIYKGAILTFIILVVIELIKNNLYKREYKKNFVIFIKLELSAILKNLEKLKLKVTEQGFFDFNYISEIEKVISELENARTSAIYLTDKNQIEYFDIVYEIRSFISECKFIQALYYNHLDLFEGRKDARDIRQMFSNQQENQLFFDQKKVEKIVTVTEIKTKTEKFIKEIEGN